MNPWTKKERATVKSLFSPKEIRELVNITYRQIQYWDKSNFIIPSYRRKGRYRLYTFKDLVLLKIAEVLREHGYSIQQLRSTIGNLKKMIEEISFPFTELNILFKGDEILLFNGEVIMSDNDDEFIRFSVKEFKAKLERLYEEPAA